MDTPNSQEPTFCGHVTRRTWIAFKRVEKMAGAPAVVWAYYTNIFSLFMFIFMVCIAMPSGLVGICYGQWFGSGPSVRVLVILVAGSSRQVEC